MTDLREKSEKGRQARQLFENPLFQEVMKYYRDSLVDRWERSLNAEEREDLWRQQLAARELIAGILRVVENGQIADQEIEYLNAKA